MVTWDLLVQNWNDVTGWTKAGAGTSDIDPAGQLRQIPNSATYVNQWRDIGALPTTYTAEFRLKIDDFGDSGLWTHDFYDGVHRMNFQIFPTYVYNADSAQSINVVTTEGIFYIWRLVIDSAGGHIYVYRDEEYLGDLGAGLVYAPGDGTIYATAGNGAGDNFEAHEDWLLIATGLHYVESEEDLKATFHVGQDSKDLKATFDVGQGSENLFGRLGVRNADTADLFNKLIVKNAGAVELFSEFIVRHSSFGDLLADLIVKNADAEDLHCFFHVGQDSKKIFSKMAIRHTNTLEIFGELVIRHTSIYDMPAQFEVGQGSEGLLNLMLINGIGYIVRGEHAF